MDWQKTIEIVTSFARKVVALGLSAIVVMVTVTAVYSSALALWWLAERVQTLLGG